ncbi:RNA methyltransferase [Geotalea toluenoxydans]
MEEYSPTAPNVSIALLHYPVYNKNRDVVATAVTNLDLHDIARSARTFGLYRYFVITPVAEQRSLSERIRAHWLEGYGAAYNPKRKAALELIEVIDSLQTALAQLEKKFGKPVKVIVTGAQGRDNSIDCSRLGQLLQNRDQPYLLLFGTGWGMTEEVFEQADYVLGPIKGPGDYNHLAVRSAAAIILDRLFGNR